MALYVSVMTDTGSFRYSSTNPEAMRVAADLIEAGADPWEVSSAIYEQQPVERLHLLREVLGTLRVSTTASSRASPCPTPCGWQRPAMKICTDGFINFARGIAASRWPPSSRSPRLAPVSPGRSRSGPAAR